MANEYLVDHVTLLCDSYRHWTGRELVGSDLSAVEAARALYYSPFAVVSHDTASDPIFNYANRKALELFEMEWAEFTSLPSRLSAEAVNQQKRAESLKTVEEQGYIDGYSGVRISASGRRFNIANTVIWNLIDADGEYAGQAAMFADWKFL